MRGYMTISDEEKNSILQTHSAFYNGYATGNIPSGPQPLLQDEGPSDSQGITVNNRGEVGQYKNHLVNESVENEKEIKEYDADDMDVSDVESAYDFESGGPDQFGDEDMTYSDDSHGMDIDSIMSMFDGSITADYDDEVPAYQFDSEGAMDVDLYEGADEDGDGLMALNADVDIALMSRQIRFLADEKLLFSSDNRAEISATGQVRIESKTDDVIIDAWQGKELISRVIDETNDPKQITNKEYVDSKVGERDYIRVIPGNPSNPAVGDCWYSTNQNTFIIKIA